MANTTTIVIECDEIDVDKQYDGSEMAEIVSGTLMAGAIAAVHHDRKPHVVECSCTMTRTINVKVK